MRRFLQTAAAVPLGLAACSPPADAPDAAPASESASPSASPASTAPSPPASTGSPIAANVLTLAGLGALKIGQAVPAASGWAERGAQISDGCRTVSSRDFPGAYAIVEDGLVRRITVGQRSNVRLVDGIGTGSTEAEVRTVFPDFRETPHEYEGPPAKYLTAPDAGGGDSSLRFEIGSDGKVSLMHVGTMPVLVYVEGCA